MKQYGGLQLANPQTTPTNSTSSTMELSSTPESLQTTANSEMQKNSGITLPNPASDHIESTTQRTFEQELFYNDHPVNNTRN
jgi:hypothetical protein